MNLNEARKNIGKKAYLINGEAVLLIKLVGGNSCLTLAGPELDKYTYIQLEDMVSERERELSRCVR